MIQIGIVSNATRDIDLKFAKEISAWLDEHDCVPIINKPEAYGSKFLIVLGGDGTMLRAAHSAAPHSTPMLGINLGALGYLTDVERHEGIKAIEKMLAGDFRLEQRMMLEVRGYLALNEVLVHRGEPSGLMSFRISVQQAHMDTLRADGVLVATPTGSTAYNLSAGGPILRPDSEMTVVTAVCPHTLYARPWVLSGNDKISLQPLSSREDHATVSIDGEAKFSLKCGEEITVTQSQHRAAIVKTTDADFFEVLRKKMRKDEI